MHTEISIYLYSYCPAFAADISLSDAVLLLKLCAMQRLAVVWLLSLSAFGRAQERERESVECVKKWRIPQKGYFDREPDHE